MLYFPTIPSCLQDFSADRYLGLWISESVLWCCVGKGQIWPHRRRCWIHRPRSLLFGISQLVYFIWTCLARSSNYSGRSGEANQRRTSLQTCNWLSWWVWHRQSSRHPFRCFAEDDSSACAQTQTGDSHELLECIAASVHVSRIQPLDVMMESCHTSLQGISRHRYCHRLFKWHERFCFSKWGEILDFGILEGRVLTPLGPMPDAKEALATSNSVSLSLLQLSLFGFEVVRFAHFGFIVLLSFTEIYSKELLFTFRIPTPDHFIIWLKVGKRISS